MPSTPTLPPPKADSPNILALAIAFEGGMGILAWGLGFLLARPPLTKIQWTAHGLLWGIAATLPLLALLVVLMLVKWRPIDQLEQLVMQTVAPLFAGAGWWQLAVVAALAGIGEELLFRGVIQEAISARFAPWLGLCSASLLFGLAHPITKTYAVLAGAMGFYLGLLAVVTDNLLVPIVAHGLYDFVALAWLVHSAGRPKGAASGQNRNDALQ